MFSRGRPSLAPALLLLALISAASVAGNWVSSARAPTTPDMRGWDVADLFRHLASRGLDLHASPTREKGPISWNVFFTREKRPWEDYGRHCMDPERIGRWSGVVYCQRESRAESREFELVRWGECGLHAGPFVFFGDPAMLAEIRTTLGVRD